MKNFAFIATLVAAIFAATFVSAQNPVITYPQPVISYNASGTIAVTNTFQSIWVATIQTTSSTDFTKTQQARTACAIQNNGTNNMWVYFGKIASATKAASVVLNPGQTVYCNTNGGGVLQDQVSITGTSGDAFFAAQQ